MKLVCRYQPRILVASAVIVCGLLVFGCGKKGIQPGEGKVIPKGRILENGLPIKVEGRNLPPGDPGMSVQFISIGTVEAGTEYDAQIISPTEGSFELIGADAKGIPPGKYRVAIYLGPEGGTDYFNGKYSRDNSKIEVEVKEGEDLVIDVANYK